MAKMVGEKKLTASNMGWPWQTLTAFVGLATLASLLAISPSLAAQMKKLETADRKGHYETSGNIQLPAKSHKGVWDYHKSAYLKINRDMKGIFSDDADEMERAKNFGPYTHDMTVKTNFSNQYVISTVSEYYSYTGGAHGFEYTRGVSFNAHSGKKLPPKTFFKDFKDGSKTVKGLVSLIRKKIRQKKIKNGWLEKGQKDEFLADMKANISWVDNFVLVPLKDNKTKASGLTFFYDPYEVGPYVEGSHKVFLSAAQLSPYLSKSVAPMFEDDAPVWVESK